jgi:hypothetical protein
MVMRAVLRFLHWVVFLFVALVAVIFVVQNRHAVRDLARLNQEKAQQISLLQKEVAALRPNAPGTLPAPARPGITHAA